MPVVFKLELLFLGWRIANQDRFLFTFWLIAFKDRFCRTPRIVLRFYLLKELSHFGNQSLPLDILKFSLRREVGLLRSHFNFDLCQALAEFSHGSLSPRIKFIQPIEHVQAIDRSHICQLREGRELFGRHRHRAKHMLVEDSACQMSDELRVSNELVVLLRGHGHHLASRLLKDGKEGIGAAGVFNANVVV